MSVISFKCPNCDGELIFDPASGAYKCEYCGSKFTQEELDAMKPAEEQEKPAGSMDGSQASENTDGTQEEKKTEEEAVIYTCPSCGAQIVTDATTAATFCYYCHNPVVLSGRLSGNYMPNKVIPFAIDRKEAEKRFMEYVGRKKFVPKAFFNKKQIDKLSGVYFPFWIYDTRMNGNLSAEATRVRVWRSGDEEYTETKFYEVERGGDVSLSNLELNALQKANKELVEGVLPYQFDKMKDFSMGYLSGFQAEKRDIEKEGVAEEARRETKDYATRLLRESVSGYDGVKVHNCGFSNGSENWNYVLLPIWTITYRANNGKMYYYSMNGQTGKVCGELPVDYKKLTLVSGIISAAVLVLGLLGGLLIYGKEKDNCTVTAFMQYVICCSCYGIRAKGRLRL